MQLQDIKQVSIVQYLAQDALEVKLIKDLNYFDTALLKAQSSPLPLRTMWNATNRMTSLQETTETSSTLFVLSSIVPQQKL